MLADVHKRAAYDAELRAAAASALRRASQQQSPSGRSNGGHPGFFTEYSGRREPCRRTAEHSRSCVCMPCRTCSQWHHVYVTDRHRSAAFWCNYCDRCCTLLVSSGVQGGCHDDLLPDGDLQWVRQCSRHVFKLLNPCYGQCRTHAGINRHVWKETTSAGFFSPGTTKVGGIAVVSLN